MMSQDCIDGISCSVKMVLETTPWSLPSSSFVNSRKHFTDMHPTTSISHDLTKEDDLLRQSLIRDFYLSHHHPDLTDHCTFTVHFLCLASLQGASF